jgi:hypothetical protein
MLNDTDRETSLTNVSRLNSTLMYMLRVALLPSGDAIVTESGVPLFSLTNSQLLSLSSEDVEKLAFKPV